MTTLLRKSWDYMKLKILIIKNICTIAINPKEYFEKLENRKINKKHKGVTRDTEGMSFEAYANQITSLRKLNCNNDKKKKYAKKISGQKYKYDDERK